VPKIDCMFAFVTSDKQPEGKDEGILGIGLRDGTMLPLVGADMDRVRSLMPVADSIAKEAGITYRILKFSNKEDITEEMRNEKQA
jgi:hypothetical protein